MEQKTYRVRRIKGLSPKKHLWSKKHRPKLNDITIKRTLAYQLMDHELADTPRANIVGLKSINPVALQCQRCFILVATLPKHGIVYLMNMAYFMQNKLAIEAGDTRRLCPTCQLLEWPELLNNFETDDARSFSREQRLVAYRIMD